MDDGRVDRPQMNCGRIHCQHLPPETSGRISREIGFSNDMFSFPSGRVRPLAPMVSSVRAKKLWACCCTKRYSMVCSGRWRA